MMSEASEETLGKEEVEDLSNQVVTAVSVTRYIHTFSFLQASSM